MMSQNHRPAPVKGANFTITRSHSGSQCSILTIPTAVRQERSRNMKDEPEIRENAVGSVQQKGDYLYTVIAVTIGGKRKQHWEATGLRAIRCCPTTWITG